MATEQELLEMGMLDAANFVRPDYDPDAILRERLFAEGKAEENIAEAGGQPWAHTADAINLQQTAMQGQGLMRGVVPVARGGVRRDIGWTDEMKPYKDITMGGGGLKFTGKGVGDLLKGKGLSRDEGRTITPELAQLAISMGLSPEDVRGAFQPKGFMFRGPGGRDALDHNMGINTYVSGRHGEQGGVGLSNLYKAESNRRWEEQMQANKPGAGGDLAEWKQTYERGNPYAPVGRAGAAGLSDEQKMFRTLARLTPEELENLDFSDENVLLGLKREGSRAGGRRGMDEAMMRWGKKGNVQGYLSKRGEVNKRTGFGGVMEMAIPAAITMGAGLINPVFGAALQTMMMKAQGADWMDVAKAVGPGLVMAGAGGSLGNIGFGQNATTIGQVMKGSSQMGGAFGAIGSMAKKGLGISGQLGPATGLGIAALPHIPSPETVTGGIAPMSTGAAGLWSNAKGLFQSVSENPYVKAGQKAGEMGQEIYGGMQAKEAMRDMQSAAQQQAGGQLDASTEAYYDWDQDVRGTLSDAQSDLLRMRQRTLEDLPEYDPYSSEQGGYV